MGSGQVHDERRKIVATVDAEEEGAARGSRDACLDVAEVKRQIFQHNALMRRSLTLLYKRLAERVPTRPKAPVHRDDSELREAVR